ncbi:hypothetical protein [Bradyrhizobium sp. LeoA1S1]
MSPSGELFAYQLKGNPGGRLSMSQWHTLIAQLQTLIYQPVSHPAIKPGTPHTPVLVTNGEIHEDVYAAITGLNAAIAAPHARSLQTIARGQLLQKIVNAADTIWPVDISTQRNVLNIFVSKGDDELPLAEFVSLLSDVLVSTKYNDAAIPALHLIAAVLASNWIDQANYFELIKMYALLAVAVACYQARWKRRRKRDGQFIEEITINLKSHIHCFVQAVKMEYERGPLINRDIFGEFAYYHPRRKMISGILSAAVLDKSNGFDEKTTDFIWSFVCKEKHSAFLLWEGIIPYCLAEFWALSNLQGTIEPHRRLFTLTRDILHSNSSDLTQLHLAGPYYSLRQVVEHKYSDFLGVQHSKLDVDDHRLRSWFAEPLFMLLARRNYKSHCQLLWPTLTRFLHARTRLPNAVDFGPARCQDAIAEDRVLDTSTQRTWEDIVGEAANTSRPLIPDSLRERPHLVLLYCLFIPQRMDRDVILWLDRCFCRTWY